MKLLIRLSAGLLLACSTSFAITTYSGAQTQFEKSQELAPDNTGKNSRDRKFHEVIPQDQSNAKSDRDITIRLRKDILAHKGLSTNAQNVKIISENGVLTLRGPVDSEKEKELIDDLAKECCGVKQYTNELEVRGRSNQ